MAYDDRPGGGGGEPASPAPTMTDDELQALLTALKADSLSSATESSLGSQREKALDYYYGDMSADMPTIEGRSRAVSTDVADTIEGLMPSLMEIFAGSDEVVVFDPVGPDDIEAAEQETDTVNHVFTQQNDGFLVLYTMIKATAGKPDPDGALSAAKGLSWTSPRGPVRIDPQTRDIIQNVYLRVVERDAGGRLVNRETETFEDQPDYGLELSRK